jgi:plastocyanin domain-containing protein
MKTALALALAFVVLGAFGVDAQGTSRKKQQQVRLTADESGYVLTPSRLSKGVPVKMDVDLQTVKGCARTVVISAFGVRKAVSKDDSTIEFVPNKSGTFDVVCGMNMVKGSLTVVDR